MLCFRWRGESNWKLVIIITVGWIKYVQYVSRLSGKNPLYDKKLLTGPAIPQQHDSVIHIKDKPHAEWTRTEFIWFGWKMNDG